MTRRTDQTWQVTSGCAKVSPGCAHCYAETMAKRLASMAEADDRAGKVAGGRKRHYLQVVDSKGRWNGKVELVPEALIDPLGWKKPRRVFVNSMSDLFHEGIPDYFIAQVFAVMESCPQHTFQVLTKRAERMQKVLSHPQFPMYVRKQGYDWLGPQKYREMGPHWRNNVWLGVSVEDQARADERIPLLLKTPAAVRFLSIEPCLGPVNLRRWIGEGKRESISGSTGAGVVLGGRERDHLETHRIRGRGDASNEVDSASAGRCQREQGGRLFEGDVSRPGGAETGGGAQNIMDARQSGADSEHHGGESQGRHQIEQPAGQFGTDDQAGEREARDSCAQVQATESTARARKLVCKADRISGDGNSGAGRGEGNVSGPNRQAIRPDPERRVGDSAEKKLGTPCIAWAILGGESGPGARPCDLAWIRSLVGQCKAAAVSCFVNQLGSHVHKTTPGGNLMSWFPNDRKGGNPAEWDEDLRVREYPTVSP